MNRKDILIELLTGLAFLGCCAGLFILIYIIWGENMLTTICSSVYSQDLEDSNTYLREDLRIVVKRRIEKKDEIKKEEISLSHSKVTFFKKEHPNICASNHMDLSDIELLRRYNESNEETSSNKTLPKKEIVEKRDCPIGCHV